MPNHIVNRITLKGDSNQVDSLLSTFSTHFERTPAKSYDGDLRYKNADGNYGFLNTETNKFFRRGKEDVVGVPDGYVQDFEEAWTRFPDFNKVVPMPEGMDITSGSIGDTAYHALFGDKTERFLIDSRERALEKLLEMDESHRIEAIGLGLQYAKNVAATGHKNWYSWSVENWGTKWNAYSCEKIDQNTYEFQTAWSGVPDLIQQIYASYPTVEILYEWSDEDTGSNCGTAHGKDGQLVVSRLENRSKEAFELAFKLHPEYRQYYALVNGNYEYVEEE